MLKLSEAIQSFDYIVCGDEGKKSKPNPMIFLTAAERLMCLTVLAVIIILNLQG